MHASSSSNNDNGTASAGALPVGWVRLNVGGKLIVTTDATLSIDLESVLAAGVKSGWAAFPKDVDGNPFLQLNARHFQVALNFLRGYRVAPAEEDIPGVIHVAQQLNITQLAHTLGIIGSFRRPPPAAVPSSLKGYYPPAPQQRQWRFVPGPSVLDGGRVARSHTLANVFTIAGHGALPPGNHAVTLLLEKLDRNAIVQIGVVHHDGSTDDLPDAFTTGGPTACGYSVTAVNTGEVFMAPRGDPAHVRSQDANMAWKNLDRIKLHVHVPADRRRFGVVVQRARTMRSQGVDNIDTVADVTVEAGPNGPERLCPWPAAFIRGGYCVIGLEWYTYTPLPPAPALRLPQGGGDDVRSFSESSNNSRSDDGSGSDSIDVSHELRPSRFMHSVSFTRP
eukprot:CAMPEP_0174847062 /NCGR_PEP_ID=MMETSP1114-20130205/12687_1 /TAXON_ID=312471 /ORGANISM="Neobodo designis, Strain CCAP 1951/1" /LENGTH=392 /DNA_ID=CAMNT_0016081333 /DNA_START=101 /DNA_END=1276 /DNA_ORIENTATION=+